MQVSETGLQLAGLNLSPFLNTGVMFAVHQSWGRVPDWSELLKRIVRHFDSGLAEAFRILDGVIKVWTGSFIFL